MNDKYFVIAIVVALTLLADGFASVSADDADKAKAALPPASTAPIDFIRDVQPIFQRACLSCHGDEKQKAGYRLDVRAVAMKEGDSYAPNIIVGKSAESPLIQFVAGSGDLSERRNSLDAVGGGDLQERQESDGCQGLCRLGLER